MPEVIFCSFGDMLRVPGSAGDLFQIKAEGGDVRVVYSPLDCLKIARANPGRKVVFFAIGFETTAPANAMAVWQARAQGVGNFSMLVSHVTVPPAITGILESPGNRVQGFLGAGHVCAIMGWEEYEPLAARYRMPIVVTGFEPIDLLEGILMAVRQLESGRFEVENQYARAVARQGNLEARRMIERVFEPCDRAWRGIGVIPLSGYQLREEFAAYDAARLFDLGGITAKEPEECISGLVLAGRAKAARLPRVRNALHAGNAAWSDHGFFRRSLRGLLQLREKAMIALSAIRYPPSASRRPYSDSARPDFSPTPDSRFSAL